jgi:hypothetical protein
MKTRFIVDLMLFVFARLQKVFQNPFVSPINTVCLPLIPRNETPKMGSPVQRLLDLGALLSVIDDSDEQKKFFKKFN